MKDKLKYLTLIAICILICVIMFCSVVACTKEGDNPIETEKTEFDSKAPIVGEKIDNPDWEQIFDLGDNFSFLYKQSNGLTVKSKADKKNVRSYMQYDSGEKNGKREFFVHYTWLNEDSSLSDYEQSNDGVWSLNILINFNEIEDALDGAYGSGVIELYYYMISLWQEEINSVVYDNGLSAYVIRLPQNEGKLEVKIANGNIAYAAWFGYEDINVEFYFYDYGTTTVKIPEEIMQLPPTDNLQQH